MRHRNRADCDQAQYRSADAKRTAIREKLWKEKPAECVAGCARLRLLRNTPLLQTLTTTLSLLAKRWLMLAEELKALDGMLENLTRQHAKRLREKFGVGPQTAAVLVAVAGDNPERLRSEAALAALYGVSPLQASSGKTILHRLNRGGDRSANKYLLDHRHGPNAQRSSNPRLCRSSY